MTTRRPAPGVALTLWTGGDLARALTPEMRRLIAEARPPVVCLHAGPDRLAGAATKLAHDVRAILPDVRLHLGVGCDYWIGAAINGGASEVRAAANLIAAARLGASLGCEAVVFDAEAAMKADSLVASRITRAVISEVRTRHPALLLGHTAYDHPTLHSDDVDGQYDDGHRRGEYAWRAWLGADGVDYSAWQNYVAPETGVAGKGALARRQASSRASVKRATALGWIRQELGHEGYLQAHGVPFAQTVTGGAAYGLVYLWCGPELPRGRMDESGAWALRGLCALERAGARTPEGIRALQAKHGLVIDGIAGRKTLAAIGLQVPAAIV